MNPTSDTTTPANGGNFDPQQAAALLDQTTRQARRNFGPAQPLLFVYRAVLALVVFGGCWLSVRSHPNPYSAPSGWVVPVTVVLVAINIGWTTAVLKRAGTGVRGPAQRRRQIQLGVLLALWIVAYAFTVPLYHATASHPVWGLYPASAPLLIIGVLAAITSAALRDRLLTGIGLALAIVGTAAGFGGPAGAWLIMGIGLSAIMLAAAGFVAWQQRRSVIRP